MAKEHAPIDAEYFRLKLQTIQRDIYLYNALDLSSELTRLAIVAGKSLRNRQEAPPSPLSNVFNKVKALPRFTFLSPKEGGVKRYADSSGNWIEHYEVIKLLEEASESVSVHSQDKESNDPKAVF